MKWFRLLLTLPILFVFLFILTPALNPVSAATYYVSRSDGNDQNCTGLASTPYTSGTQVACPWQSIAKLNVTSFEPGDSVLFKKGDLWREEFIMPSAGVEGNPITYASYGEGDKPKIYGSYQPATWELESVVATPAVSRVQKNSNLSLSASVTTTLPTAPTQGDLLVAVAWGLGNHSNATISGWLRAGGVATTYTKSMTIFYRVAQPSDSPSIRLDWPGSTETVLTVEEWSGLSTPQLSGFVSTPNTSLVTAKSSGALTLSTANPTLLLSSFAHGSTVTNRQYTNSFSEDENVNNSNIWQVASRVVSQAGTYETTQSWTTSRLAGGALAAFSGTAISTPAPGAHYYTPVATDPGYLWFINHDGTTTNGHKVTSKALLISPYDWWYDTVTHRLYLASDTHPAQAYASVEVTDVNRTRGIMWDTDGEYGYANIDGFEIAYLTGDAITIRHSSRVTNNYIHHLGWEEGGHSHGIEINAGSNSYVGHNVVHDTMQSGLYMVASWAPYISDNNIFEYNTVYNCANYLIWNNLHVANSKMSGNIIRYNTLYHTSDYTPDIGYGINLTGSAGIPIDHHQIYYNTISTQKRALNLDSYVTGTAVYNNTVYSRSGTGIYLSGTGTANLTLQNNLVAGAGLYGLQVPTLVSSFTLDHNLLYAPSGIAYASVAGVNYRASDQATYQINTGWDAHGLWEDPALTSLETRDYHLNSTSAAINAGASVGLSQDIASATVPQGSVADIGAYEYLSLTPTLPLPSALAQLRTDTRATLPGGQWTNASSLTLEFLLSASTPSTLTPQVEVVPATTAFTGSPTHTGLPVTYDQTPVLGSVVVADLSEGLYHWQAESSDATAILSGFVPFATDPSFGIDRTPPSSPRSPLAPTWRWEGVTDQLSGLADSPYQIQWCQDPSYLGCDSLVATTSEPSYTPSPLSPGTWYFRVRAIDQAGNTTPYKSLGSVNLD